MSSSISVKFSAILDYWFKKLCLRYLPFLFQLSSQTLKTANIKILLQFPTRNLTYIQLWVHETVLRGKIFRGDRSRAASADDRKLAPAHLGIKFKDNNYSLSSQNTILSSLLEDSTDAWDESLRRRVKNDFEKFSFLKSFFTFPSTAPSFFKY